MRSCDLHETASVEYVNVVTAKVDHSLLLFQRYAYNTEVVLNG